MLEPENILCVEYTLNETLLQITYKENDDICMYQMPNQPSRKQYEVIKKAGWTPAKIRKNSKELGLLENEHVKLISRISNGYSLAKEEVEKIRAEKDFLTAEKDSVVSEERALLKDIAKIREELQELYREQKLAIETLHDLYNEQKGAIKTLKDLYGEQNQASNRVADLYKEYETREVEQMEGFTNKVKAMKMKMQENYDKYQELYGANILDIIFEDESGNKEFLFKAKLEVLAKPEFKEVDKSVRTKIRKAKTIKDLLFLIYDVIEEK